MDRTNLCYHLNCGEVTHHVQFHEAKIELQKATSPNRNMRKDVVSGASPNGIEASYEVCRNKLQLLTSRWRYSKLRFNYFS